MCSVLALNTYLFFLLPARSRGLALIAGDSFGGYHNGSLPVNLAYSVPEAVNLQNWRGCLVIHVVPATVSAPEYEFVF